METKQIYNIINLINTQTLGAAATQVVDAASFVAVGQQILSSSDITENFTNELVLRIARSIVSFRRYDSVYRPIVFDDLRWGAVVQKMKAEMPTAMADEAYDLEEGKSVDMYIVQKPRLHQKFFVNRTPYSFMVTIQRWQLQRAFTSESAFAELISSIFGEVQNKLEMTFEGLGRTTLNFAIGSTIGTTQEIKLLTNYNAATSSTLTAQTALFDSGFLRYAVAQMNTYSRRLAVMSNLYNQEQFDRHTPKRFQRLATISDFEEQLATVVQWAAFNKQFVSMETSMSLPFWQSVDDPYGINVSISDTKNVEATNIVAVIHDRDALGTYRKEQEVLTTPVNARGRYTNTFWHEEQMWFCDLSENIIVFTLN